MADQEGDDQQPPSQDRTLLPGDDPNQQQSEVPAPPMDAAPAAAEEADADAEAGTPAGGGDQQPQVGEEQEGDQQQQQPGENVQLHDTTEHQVGETEEGEAIIGRDRGAAGINFGAVDQAAAAAQEEEEQQQQQQPAQNDDDQPPPSSQDNNVGSESADAGAAASGQKEEIYANEQAAAAPAVAAPAPSQPSAPPAEPTLPVRVVARPGGFASVVNIPLSGKTGAIITQVARAWAVDPQGQQFRLMYEGKLLDGSDLLKTNFVFQPRFTAASVEQGQITEYHEVVCEAEFDLLPEHLRVLAPGDDVLRVLTVVVRANEDAAMAAPAMDDEQQQQLGEADRTFKLATVRALERKPFLGGFRNKRTEAIYHDAACQTAAASQVRRNTIQRQSKKELITRMTQTQGKTRSCQTTSECGTQMPRSDLQATEEFDRVVIALPYFSAEQLLSVHVQKAIRIQSLARGWRARKLAKDLRDAREAEESELAAEDERRRELHRQRRQEEVNRRVHPRSGKDFAILYNELEAWRLQEGQRIREAKNVPEVEKALALQELLKKETKLLQTIDRLQLQANQENRQKRVQSTLDKMAAPKVWGSASAAGTTKDGKKPLEVETPFTTRAKELRDLYNGLLLKGLGVDERLDVLLHVKWTVKEFNCALTRDIVELVDREADLLNRGRKDASLDSLRVRTANLFLQFCETPEFNPEAINFQRAPLEFASRPQVALTKR